MRSRFLALLPTMTVAAVALAQIPGLGRPRIPGIPGLDAIMKKGPAITTSLKDAKWEAPSLDKFEMRESRSLYTLQRTPNGGFVLQPGGYTATLQSYCLHAGTHSPGEGNGYLYAPIKGPIEDAVMTIGRNSVQHPEIEQRDIQTLIWAMLARTKFTDMTDKHKSIAAKLLTPRQIADLNGGALGLLTDDKIGGAFIKEPPIIRQVLEAEARLRNMITAPGTTFEDLERVAVLTGNVPEGPGSREVPSGRWSNHPDGYMVRYFPSGYSTTKIEIWVPQDSPAIGKEFDPATQVAVPVNTARQRLFQTAREKREN
ncbi:MAG: hypothetical protein ACO1SV_24750 [Fimbriimonas sp.]